MTYSIRWASGAIAGALFKSTRYVVVYCFIAETDILSFRGLRPMAIASALTGSVALAWCGLKAVIM